MPHACKLMKRDQQQVNVITLGDSTIKVITQNRQTIPPETGKAITANISGKAVVQELTDKVFSFKNLFINKIHAINKERPM